MTVLGIIFMIIEALILGFLLTKLVRNKQVSLKNTAVYPFLMIISIFLVMAAESKYGDHETWWEVISPSVNAGVNVLVLKIDVTFVKLLQSNNVILLTDYLILYFTSLLALLSLSIALLQIAIKNTLRLKWFKKEINYIFGNNDETKTYIQNLTKEQRKNTVVVLDRANPDENKAYKMFLDENKIRYLSENISSEAGFLKALKRLTRNHDKKKYCIVYFGNNDAQIHSSVKWSQKFLEQNNLFEKNIRFVVSANGQSDFVRELIKGIPTGEITVDGKAVPLKDVSRGAIRCFDKYEMLAYEFVQKHNFAKYFPKDLLRDNCTVKDCDVNLYLLGFGKVSQALLKDILIENQFVTVRNKKLHPLRINVEAFDQGNRFVSTDLNYGILKYDKTAFGADHLELPEDYRSCVRIHFNKNTGENDFVNNIYDDVKHRGKTKPQVNFFVISLDSDRENSLLAKKLQECYSLIPNCYNTFFVRTKQQCGLPVAKGENIVYFGNEKALLNYDNVVADKIFMLAKKESCVYLGKETTEENVNREWSLLSPIKQQSNLYAVASLPFKLALLGFDGNFSEEEFWQKYDPNGERHHYLFSDKLATKGDELSARDVLAFVEHERWNAFELSMGVLPMKTSDCYDAETNTFANKSHNEIYHLCLTTQAGLVQYYDLVSKLIKEKGVSAEPDVIKYDYDLMDNLPACADLLIR